MTYLMEIKRQRKDAAEKAHAAGVEEGHAAGVEEGHAAGVEETKINSIRNLMETMKWTAKQAMDALKIPVSEQDKYAAQV